MESLESLLEKLKDIAISSSSYNEMDKNRLRDICSKLEKKDTLWD